MIDEIKTWLNSKRDFSQGVALYLKYGRNANIKRQLVRSNPGGQIAAKMVYELEKLAKTPTLIKQRPAKKKAAAKPKPEPVINKKALDLVTLPDVLSIDIAAYSESNFDAVIFDELPDELKKDYLKIIDLAKAMRSIHWQLRGIDHSEKARRQEMASKIVDGKDEEARLWERINHWQQHGVVLSSTKPTEDVGQMSDLDLIKFENNRKASVSRYEKRVQDFQSKYDRSRDEKQRHGLKHSLLDAVQKLNEHRANLEAARGEINKRQNAR